MWPFTWFGKGPTRPEDYESVLAALASDINDAKMRLSEVRLRERRFSLFLNIYGISLWALWTGCWYQRVIPWRLLGWNEYEFPARAVGVGGVVAGPVILILLNQLIRIVFRKIRTSQETNLRLLLSKQRKQVDEIKKVTNYDTTRKLLEQYDAMNVQPQEQGQPSRQPQQGLPSSSAPSTPQRSRPDSPTSSVAGTPQNQIPQTPSPIHSGGHAAPVPPHTPVPLPPGMTQEQAALFAMQLQAIQPILPTPEKKWYDRLADTILGDDPAQAANSKFALVCSNCFRHNGLIGNKYEWERMQWICPRCDHLNAAPLSRIQMTDELPEPETPSKPARKPAVGASAQAPVPVGFAGKQPHLQNPGIRRRSGHRGQSRLGTEVFSAADHDEAEEMMEVDKK